jgi:DnaJ-class molecular chaperone
MDYYTVLGIPRDANEFAIRSAYRVLARRYHPDSGIGSSTEKFREAVEAYETLIDPGRRQGYDLSLQLPAEALWVRVEPTFQYPVSVHQFDPFEELIRSLKRDMFFLLRRW